MKKIMIAPLTVGALLVLGGPLFAQSSGEESREKPIALSSVPQAAKDAAKQALGSDPTEAKIISGTRPQQYELEARNSSGQEASVHVRGDGRVIKRETENEEQERNERR
ncbi:MAG TPA: hypothetical protein VN685_01985 [Rhizomicrobium sp.]|nr:hypothetical protein [Rhizomicrobium sp.]